MITPPTTLDTAGVATELLKHFRNHDNLALFAGSGIGCRVGLPTWAELINKLADFTEEYDADTARLIKTRCEDGYLTNAALIYKTCPLIPRGEIFKALAAPFTQKLDHQKLNALISLPFSAVVTTNYDRSIHHSYSNVLKTAPKTVELNDPTMQSALFEKDFFIARIHGRAEVPNSMIIDEKDYSSLRENKVYTDFVTNILTRYSCIFVGFSFLDPSIAHILSLIEEFLSPNYPELHIALLPNNAKPEFIKKLSDVNIRPLFYNSSFEHFALWEGIKEASRDFTLQEKLNKPVAKIPLEAIHRFLATAYARVKMSGILEPLRNVILDGIIIDIIRDNGNKIGTGGYLEQSLKDILRIKTADAKQITTKRLEYLHAIRAIDVTESEISLCENGENSIQIDLSILTRGVINRLFVRHNENDTPELESRVSRCIEKILLARSWDLGASFVGVDSIGMLDISATVHSVVEKESVSLHQTDKDKLSLALLDLFHHPTTTESEILSNLGRVSYALQLVLNIPSAAASRSSLLPETIYLDSNVLMPAIVKGHPYYPVYSNTLKRLRDASQSARVKFSVGVSSAFLNEVISHRRIAIREVNERDLNNPDKLADYILYAGAVSPNVFIGAYATKVGRQKRRISFNTFLQEIAPYSNEGELMAYLDKQRIKTYTFSIYTASEQRTYDKIYQALLSRNSIKPDYQRKESILIAHDAEQLYQLAKDISKNKKSIFVTADKRLVEDAKEADVGKPMLTMMSHRGLIQLVDMLVGLKADPVSMTSLLWGGLMTDETTIVINYFTNLALQTQEEAMAMSLSEVLETFVPVVLDKAHQENISLISGTGRENQAKLDSFLDRFEDIFYEEMAAAIQKYAS